MESFSFFWLIVSITGIELKKGLKQPSMYTRASLERKKVMARKEKEKRRKKKGRS